MFAEPKLVADKKRVSSLLAKTLGVDERETLRALSDVSDSYVPLKHYVSEGSVKSLKELGLVGIGYSPEMKRLYPHKSLFGAVPGFLGYLGSARG